MIRPSYISEMNLGPGNIVLCFSGGIDSFVGLHYFDKSCSGIDRNVDVVYFNLGSRYTGKELKYAKNIYPTLLVDDSLSWLGRFEIGDKAFVPYRNLLIAMFASVKYAPNVCICGVKDDVVEDKNEQVFQEWSEHLSKLGRQQIKVFSPFWGNTKNDIVYWYLNNGGSEQEILKTVSCYNSKDTNYCGECYSCFRKWVALRNNGILLDFYNKEILNEYKKKCEDGLYDKDRNSVTLRVINEYIC